MSDWKLSSIWFLGLSWLRMKEWVILLKYFKENLCSLWLLNSFNWTSKTLFCSFMLCSSSIRNTKPCTCDDKVDFCCSILVLYCYRLTDHCQPWYIFRHCCLYYYYFFTKKHYFLKFNSNCVNPQKKVLSSQG